MQYEALGQTTVKLQAELEEEQTDKCAPLSVLHGSRLLTDIACFRITQATQMEKAKEHVQELEKSNRTLVEQNFKLQTSLQAEVSLCETLKVERDRSVRSLTPGFVLRPCFYRKIDRPSSAIRERTQRATIASRKARGGGILFITRTPCSGGVLC